MTRLLHWLGSRSLLVLALSTASTTIELPCQADPASKTEKGPPRLADPTGPWLVGTRIEVWTDERRKEVLSEDPKDKRSLVVQFWYPSSKKTGRGRPADWHGPYVPFYETMKPLLQEQCGAGAEALKKLRVPAKPDAPVARSAGRLPILIWSHGVRTSRIYYQTTLLELGSHGYLVLSLDHAYDVEGVAYPDGTLRRGLQGLSEEEQKRIVPAEHRGLDARIGIWGRDQVFLVRELLRRAKKERGWFLKGRVDAKRIAAAGHCFGGMAALEAALDESRIRVVMAQNAWPPSSRVRTAQLRRPLLLLASEHTTTTDSLSEQGLDEAKIASLKKTYIEQQLETLAKIAPGTLRVEIQGAEHMSFADEFHLEPYIGSPREDAVLRPGGALSDALALMRAMLDRELRGKKKQPLLVPGGHQGFSVDKAGGEGSSGKRRKKGKKR